MYMHMPHNITRGFAHLKFYYHFALVHILIEWHDTATEIFKKLVK